MIKDLVLKSFFTRFTESWNIAYILNHLKNIHLNIL